MRRLAAQILLVAAAAGLMVGLMSPSAAKAQWGFYSARSRSMLLTMRQPTFRQPTLRQPAVREPTVNERFPRRRVRRYRRGIAYQYGGMR